jgi:hypothetical protein
MSFFYTYNSNKFPLIESNKARADVILEKNKIKIQLPFRSHFI